MDLFDGWPLVPPPPHPEVERGDLITIAFPDRTEQLYLVTEKRRLGWYAYELDLLADPEPR
jgi:hypothetical protein